MDLEALNPLAFGSAAGSQETMSKSVLLHDLDYVLVLEHVPLAHASGVVLHGRAPNPRVLEVGLQSAMDLITEHFDSRFGNATGAE